MRVTGIWVRDGFESSGFYPYRFVEEGLARHGIGWPGIALRIDAQSDPGDLMAPFAGSLALGEMGPYGTFPDIIDTV